MKDYYQRKYHHVIRLIHSIKDNYSLRPFKQEEIKYKVLAQIKNLPQQSETTNLEQRLIWQDWGLRSVRFALVATIIIAAGTGTVHASEAAQPGDSLYPVKLLSESVQLHMSIRDESVAEVQTEIAERRLQEHHDLQVYTVEVPHKNQPVLRAQELSPTPKAAVAREVEQPPLPAQKLTREEAQEAVIEVEQRFQQAMESLQETKDRLHENGNHRAAEALETNIERLQQKAQSFTARDQKNPNENSAKTINNSDRAINSKVNKDN